MNFQSLNDPQQLFENYISLTEKSKELKILYFEKCKTVFESLENYRYLYCFIIYIEALLELEEYDDVDTKLDEAIIQALGLENEQQFLTVYPILLFHKSQVQFLLGNHRNALTIARELVRIKKPDCDTVDLIFHSISEPAPSFIAFFHNLAVALLLSSAVILGFQLFEFYKAHEMLRMALDQLIWLTFLSGLLFAFGGDLYHYIISKWKTRVFIKKHTKKL